MKGPEAGILRCFFRSTDSPHWDSLDAFFSTPDALEALREIVAIGRLGEAWKRLRDEIHHQGSVSPMAFDFDFGDPALRHPAATGPLRRLMHAFNTDDSSRAFTHWREPSPKTEIPCSPLPQPTR